jgi:hypothetical protein
MPTYTSAQEQEIYFVEPGQYQVEIISAENATSLPKPDGKGNNPMIKAKCRVLLPDGTKGPLLREYLTFTDSAAFRIDQFRRAMGQTVTPGEKGNLEPEDMIGKILLAEIGEEPGSKNPDARFNKIASWVSPKSSAPAPKAKPAKETDDIPF